MRISKFLFLSSVLIFSTIVTTFGVRAQGMIVQKLVLPDGSIIAPNKLDSVRNAWAGDRISFRHNDEDDQNHVIHLVRISGQQLKDAQAAENKHQEIAAAMLNKTSPQWAATDLNGKHFSLTELKGKVIVLNFWFVGCAPCLEEMPTLNLLVKKYKHNNDVVFVAVTFDDNDRVNTFLKAHPFNYRMITNAQAVHNLYDIYYCPTSIIIDKNGLIKHIGAGGPGIGKTLDGVIQAAVGQDASAK
jgi:thiol-disulfide isomerase/thioredoxin